MKYIYVVAVSYKNQMNEKLSQECYSSLQDAQEFILSRNDNPEQMTEFQYQSESNNYNIYELQLKEV